MTREEALNKIGELVVYARAQGWDEEFTEAFESLSEECEDAISRNMALSEVKSGMIRTIDGENWKRVNDNVRDILALPPVTPKQKMGRWIEHKQYGIVHLECSECSVWFLRAYLIRNSYCPNCGAKMVEPQKSEERR